METRQAVSVQLRGVWVGVRDLAQSRGFYERLGARFHEREEAGGIASALFGGTRLVFEAWSGRSSHEGLALLFDVEDADAFHAALVQEGFPVEDPPHDEPWGRQFNVRDPDGHLIAFIGPAR